MFKLMLFKFKLVSIVAILFIFSIIFFQSVYVKGQQTKYGEIEAIVPGIDKFNEDIIGPYVGFDISIVNKYGKSFWMEYNGAGRYVLKDVERGIYELFLFSYENQKLPFRRAKFRVGKGEKVKLRIEYAWLVCNKEGKFSPTITVSHGSVNNMGFSKVKHETWSLLNGRNLVLNYCNKRKRKDRYEFKSVHFSFDKFDVFGKKAVLDTKKQVLTIFGLDKYQLMKKQTGIKQKKSQMIVSLKNLKAKTLREF